MNNTEIINVEIESNDTIGVDIINGNQVNMNVEQSSGTTNYERLSNKPQINDVVLVGNKTLEELGIVNDKHFVFVQDTSLDIWEIDHDLDKFPAVTVFDSANEEVVGDVIYNSKNKITIRFNGAFKGTAVLN